MCLLQSVVSDWQAGGRDGWKGAPGSDDEPNLPRLEVELTKACSEIQAGQGNHKSAAKNISDTLNELWDPAWNVVAAKTYGGVGVYVVLYGYAFRSHWAWYNPYRDTDCVFVVWKDYNCETWVNFGKGDPA